MGHPSINYSDCQHLVSSIPLYNTSKSSSVDSGTDNDTNFTSHIQALYDICLIVIQNNLDTTDQQQQSKVGCEVGFREGYGVSVLVEAHQTQTQLLKNR